MHASSYKRTTTRVTMDLLRDDFGEDFISRSGLLNWPPRLCDLTPLDYFLGGYVKAHVYTENLSSIDAWEDNIEALLGRVCQNWTNGMDHMRNSSSQHLHEIIFKD